MWILGGTLPPVRLSVSRVSVDPVRLPRSRPPLNKLGGGEWWVGRERIVGIMIVIVIERTGLGSENETVQGRVTPKSPFGAFRWKQAGYDQDSTSPTS